MGGREPEGSVMTVVFTVDDQEFTVLHGGPRFQLNEAISLHPTGGAIITKGGPARPGETALSCTGNHPF